MTQSIDTQRASRRVATHSKRTLHRRDAGFMEPMHSRTMGDNFPRVNIPQPDVNGKTVRGMRIGGYKRVFAKSKFHPPTGHTRGDLEAEVSTVPAPQLCR